MASVFTYDPDPPRIFSPWLSPGAAVSIPGLRPSGSPPANGAGRPFQLLGDLAAPQPIPVSELGIVKLAPEPQEGPTEYKLHLLLRPRRALIYCSTGSRVSGSHASNRPSPSPAKQLAAGNAGRREDGDRTGSPTSGVFLPVPTIQARESRMQHLTTQLLWRLQQSSPFHSSVTAASLPPILPDLANGLASSPTAAHRSPLELPGLAESRGALYEIGVADDGSLVGLARDELDESIATLCAMAASLGCTVDIRRVVVVGHCSWHEAPATESSNTASSMNDEDPIVRSEPLLTAEAFVSPHTTASFTPPMEPASLSMPKTSLNTAAHASLPPEVESQTEQLRVTIIGATAAGKSSLLGTLSTSTLDNGRGKSRLSLLKHHHEVQSGRTSSVAQELLGYKKEHDDQDVVVVNYGLGNVSTWIDIHHHAAGGRLVLCTDSAGHPRYRRTLVRSLVAWAPHCVTCCIAADFPGGAEGDNANISIAHIEMCLRLGLPLVIVMTKMDVAGASLREYLTTLLAQLRSWGRTPILFKPGIPIAIEAELQAVAFDDIEAADAKLLQPSGGEQQKIVPIAFVSAVTGAGISGLHAILRDLPIPSPRSRAHVPACFHIDDIFVRPGSVAASVAAAHSASDPSVVLSGLLQQGHLAVGDVLLMGPFPSEETRPRPMGDADLPRSRSFPSANPVTKRDVYSHAADASYRQFRNFSTQSKSPMKRMPVTGITSSQWVRIRITSVRNLRLPVRALLADQAGTVGITILGDVSSKVVTLQLQKGMVLLSRAHLNTGSGDASATAVFRARFPERDYDVMEPGASFQVYIASTRALARIRTVDAVARSTRSNLHEENALFELEVAESQQIPVPSGPGQESSASQPSQIEVTFQFAQGREWISFGAQVLVMPGNAVEGSVGLDAFVGRVVGIDE